MAKHTLFNMYNFFTSIEFYVIACVVAAAIVFFCSKPQQVGEARQFLLGGFLCFDTDDKEEGDNDENDSSQKAHLPQNAPTGFRYPANVSISGFQASSDQASSNQTSPNQASSIVEVTENGYRNISTSNHTPTSKGNRQGKNQSQNQSKSNVPGWITGSVEGKEPEIDLLCMEGGTVKLIRKGLNGLVTADGAVSLACTLIGFDLKIEERLTYGGRNLQDPAPTEAVFSLEFLAPNEHYHIHYNSDTIHRMAAFTLATKEGIHIVKPLT